ncbi:hypothetical protein HMN09_01001800 [Mycena chlorophos]|uniref:Short-chain dehydrogenase/reductase family protein n=1 Tax=Mycena chlorophos TaxID=658473 RepID=A0A8H6W1W1_MYCCL|nr:hypothetical protein HMN09_01000900 [Mycena chlorophos]KAF7299941.1 hypothetical protein HMN09_01001800 [Mycena chlorophos]
MSSPALPTFGFSTTAEEVSDALAGELAGKNVLVTGTSVGGLGYETARAIAKHAGLVVITGHNAERLQLSVEAIRKAVPGAKVQAQVLDLSSLASVRKAAEEINKDVTPLHVIVHNAADTSSVYAVTVDGHERQMAVAHFSPFLLTKLIFPKLLASASDSWVPRVVLVSSKASSMGPGIDLSLPSLNNPAPDSPQVKNLFLRYHEAKSANVLFALELAKRGVGKIRAYSLHPGTIYTNGLKKDAAIPAMQSMGVLKEDGQPNPEFTTWKTIEQGAATTVVAAFDPRLNDKSGAYLVDCVEANDQRTDICSDSANAEKLWKLTEEVLGEEFVL